MTKEQFVTQILQACNRKIPLDVTQAPTGRFAIINEHQLAERMWDNTICGHQLLLIKQLFKRPLEERPFLIDKPHVSGKGPHDLLPVVPLEDHAWVI